MEGMIPEEERSGLLAEAEYAEMTGANGGMVLLTPEYTRHIMTLLERAEIALSFYSDPASFQSDADEFGPYTDIERDKGKLARQALGEEEWERV